MTLSWAAIDILRETLRLNHWCPFEIPHHGRTDEERANVRGAVLADLEHRGLARSGDPEPDLVHSLRLLDRPLIALTVIARLGDGDELRARVVSSGQRAVIAVQTGRALRVDPIRPTSMIAAALGLIPDKPAGPGQSVTFPIIPTPAAQATNIMHPAGDSGAGYGRQRHLARVILARPRSRVGQFGLTVRDRHGKENRLPELMWFDTDAGRYLTEIRRGPDGHDWATYSPADNARIAAHLTDLLAWHTST